METKSIFASKTLWFNIITILIGIVEVVSKTYPIPTEILTIIIGSGNFLLRLLSGQPLAVGGKALLGKFRK